MKSQQNGFTLIEIAIVLVIIGLLAGGILKGQQIIENAKYKAFVNEIDAIRTATNAFRDKYKYLPGDYPAANVKLSFGGINVKSGNGDGIVQAGYCDTLGEESCHVWQHLIAAGLLSGDASLVSITDSPRTSISGGVYQSISTGAWTTGRMALKLLTQSIPGNIAQRFDNEFDDGKASTGKIACHTGGTYCLTQDSEGLYQSDRAYNIFIEL